MLAPHPSVPHSLWHPYLYARSAISTRLLLAQPSTNFPSVFLVCAPPKDFTSSLRASYSVVVRVCLSVRGAGALCGGAPPPLAYHW